MEVKDIVTEQQLPAKVSKWSKVRQFLTKDIKVVLTPYQEQVFSEVHDFWHHEVT
jgi:hypothetical protein